MVYSNGRDVCFSSQEEEEKLFNSGPSRKRNGGQWQKKIHQSGQVVLVSKIQNVFFVCVYEWFVLPKSGCVDVMK